MVFFFEVAPVAFDEEDDVVIVAVVADGRPGNVDDLVDDEGAVGGCVVRALDGARSEAGGSPCARADVDGAACNGAP